MKTLEYNRESKRMRIGERDLHCGDCFQLQVGREWKDVRIEHATAWYLVGIQENNWAMEHEGSEARFYSDGGAR
jgi:hypothetical protein